MDLSPKLASGSQKNREQIPTLLFSSPPQIPQRSSSSSHSSPSSSNTVYSDRFIPSHTGSNFALFELAHSTSSSSPSPEGDRVSSRTRYDSSGAYAAALRSVMFGLDDGGRCWKEESTSGSSSSTTSPNGNRNIFRYKTDVCVRERLGAVFQDDEPLFGAIKTPINVSRKVPPSPYKVLDAPTLRDDFYLNLVDWSSNNMLAVGLGNCVYLWNACSSKVHFLSKFSFHSFTPLHLPQWCLQVTKLCDLGVDNSVCSVGWTQKGNHLAVGTNSGNIEIWDPFKCRNIRTMGGHHLRVGTLAWSSSVLSSGGRDRIILHHDIRTPSDCIGKLIGHKSEVCGLKWSCDNRQLASGGNDNQLLVWNQHSTCPVLKYSEHTAAVKAIAWSPHSYSVLASGGGTADRCIRLWNTCKNSRLNCVDTGSQVCNIGWSKNINEIVSTHGYSQNQIVVWRYPSMSKLATLTGHTYRVLHLAISPDGQTIVTGAGDETLRFWNVFPSTKSQNSSRDIGSTCLGRSHIR